MEAANETKFGIKVAYGMRMMPERRIHASAETVRDTTSDDNNASQHVTSVLDS